MHAVNIILGMVITYCIGKFSRIRKENEALKAGVQAILRDRMIQSYNHYYYDKKYMPIYAKDAFIACYRSYHNLGENGVMDNIKDKVMSLHTEPAGCDKFD